MTGTIFDCKRFAVHDGPGLRTTLFLKGCPLRCPWCQNPEGLSAAIRLWHRPTDCLMCAACARACPQGALSLTDRVHVNQGLCKQCGHCVSACPVGAMSLDGREVTAEEAAEMLLRDLPFFENGGGVTLSGGEVFTQWRFALEVLTRVKARGVDTAIETCLFVPQEILQQFIPRVDHFIMDIKYFDGATHRRVVGVDNAQILENHRYLISRGSDVLVRTPLIPGYTATEDNVRAIARYLVSVEPEARYELLNFNPLCRSKYAALERDYPVEGSALSPAEMEGYYHILRQEGISNIIRE